MLAREVLFCQPDRFAVRISPTGQHLSWLGRHGDTVALYVAPWGNPDGARPVLPPESGMVTDYRWLPSGEHVVCSVLARGAMRVVGIEVATGVAVDFPRPESAWLKIFGTLACFPHEALVDMRAPSVPGRNLYRFDVRSGQSTLHFEGGTFDGLLLDPRGRVRLATIPTAQGFTLCTADRQRRALDRVEAKDVPFAHFFGVDSDEGLWSVDSRSSNTAAVVRMDLRTLRREIIFVDPEADVDDVFVDPVSCRVLAASVTKSRRSWIALDGSLAKPIEAAANADRGDVLELHSGGGRWLIAQAHDQSPIRYYGIESMRARKLFSSTPALDAVPLRPMHPVAFEAPDGLPLRGYLSLPADRDPSGAGRPQSRGSLVVLVHNGPWRRDRWGFHPYHQWLTDRGHAVLSVNFRGSTGFGRAFVDAGNGEWGRGMREDLITAARWAIQRGIAEPLKVAVMGTEYGGFAAINAVMRSDQLFCCAVAYGAPVDLVDLLIRARRHEPYTLKPFRHRIGSVETRAGRLALAEQSPLRVVNSIRVPLFIGQGALDPMSSRRKSDRFVRLLLGREIPVDYVIFKRQGHRIESLADQRLFLALVEAFLAKHLGGRVEDPGPETRGADVEVAAGETSIRTVLKRPQ